MSTFLTTAERVLQTRAREFIDELIPYEVEAEMNRGELPPGVAKAHHEKSRSLGFLSINMPARMGGPGCGMLEQVLIQEKSGRVTNALGWVVSTGPTWIADVVTDYQMERWIRPTVDGDVHECYAITEEGAGSDVDGLEAAARPEGDGYVLNGTKWHVTSTNLAAHVFFQAKLSDGPNAGRHVLFFVDMDAPGVECVRVPEYSHTYGHHHWEMKFTEVQVPIDGVEELGDAGGGLLGLQFGHEATYQPASVQLSLGDRGDDYAFAEIGAGDHANELIDGSLPATEWPGSVTAVSHPTLHPFTG